MWRLESLIGLKVDMMGFFFFIVDVAEPPVQIDEALQILIDFVLKGLAWLKAYCFSVQ